MKSSFAASVLSISFIISGILIIIQEFIALLMLISANLRQSNLYGL